MASMHLPARAAGGTMTFGTAESVRDWLAKLPEAEAPRRLEMLREGIEALDDSQIAPEARLNLLDELRATLTAAQPGNEALYLRKPLPPAAAAVRAFAATAGAWRALAVAHLRILPFLPPASGARALQRSAVALRREQFACFQAGREVSAECLRLLYDVLDAAESRGVLRSPVADGEARHEAESQVAGQVAWCCLLHFADCHDLSPAELTVANRIFRRWCGLAEFQGVPAEGARARALPLAALAGEEGISAGGLAWIDVRRVLRKMEKRIASLEAGESPEQLKLGRELSAEACVELLGRLGAVLQQMAPSAGAEPREMRLAFGPERCYAALAGRELNPPPRLDRGKREPAYERFAIFGFDKAEGQAVDVPAEIWRLTGDRAERAPDAGDRHRSPCLAVRIGEDGKQSALGVLGGLYATEAGALRGRIVWFAEGTRAAWFRGEGGGTRVPAFIVAGDDGRSVVLPASPPLRLGTRLQLEDADIRLLTLERVLERGSDFVRYAFEQQ